MPEGLTLADETFYQAAFCFLIFQLLFVLCLFLSRCLCVVKLLENMPTVGEEMRDKTSRCAFYLSLLLKLARLKSITRKCECNVCLSSFVSEVVLHTSVEHMPIVIYVCIYSWAGGRLSSHHSEQTVQNIHCGDFQQWQV